MDIRIEGDSSVGTVIAMHAEDLSLDAKYPHKKPDMMTNACPFSTMETKTKGSLGSLSSQPV